MTRNQFMVAMRALDTAARRKGSGLVWLWAGELADLVELRFGAGGVS